MFPIKTKLSYSMLLLRVHLIGHHRGHQWPVLFLCCSTGGGGAPHLFCPMRKSSAPARYSPFIFSERQIHIWVCVHIYILRVYLWVCTCVCVYLLMCTCVCMLPLRLCVFVNVYLCVCTCDCESTCVYVCICECLPVYVCVYLCVSDPRCSCWGSLRGCTGSRSQTSSCWKTRLWPGGQCAPAPGRPTPLSPGAPNTSWVGRDTTRVSCCGTVSGRK